MATPKDAAGKALYIEFRKPDYTYQVIITEGIIDLGGKSHRPRIMRRRMHSSEARKNWRFEYLVNADRVGTHVGGAVIQFADLAQAKGFAAKGLSSIMTLLNQLFHSEYKMYKEPFMVELSYEEFDQIRAGKTPTGLIRRIQRTRVAKNFGEEVAPVATPAV
jgi:hypothetical protein